MKRYEFKLVKVVGDSWLGAAVTQDLLLETLNREGGAGWVPVSLPQNVAPWRSVLFQREVE